MCSRRVGGQNGSLPATESLDGTDKCRASDLLLTKPTRA